MFVRKLFYFFRLPLIVFILNLFLSWFNLYGFYPGIDIPMHLLGGAAMAYSFILILKFLEEKKFLKINSKVIQIILLLAMVSLIAVFWEFGEFILDYFFNFSLQLSLEDTILDLFLGLTGCFAVSVFSKI